MRVTKNELIELVKEKINYVKSFEKATWDAYYKAQDGDCPIAKRDTIEALNDLHEDLAKFEDKLESLQSKNN
jgi:hypothetical protein